jgi:hypothetical protein
MVSGSYFQMKSLAGRHFFLLPLHRFQRGIMTGTERLSK